SDVCSSDLEQRYFSVACLNGGRVCRHSCPFITAGTEYSAARLAVPAGVTAGLCTDGALYYRGREKAPHEKCGSHWCPDDCCQSVTDGAGHLVMALGTGVTAVFLGL